MSCFFHQITKDGNSKIFEKPVVAESDTVVTITLVYTEVIIILEDVIICGEGDSNYGFNYSS